MGITHIKELLFGQLRKLSVNSFFIKPPDFHNGYGDEKREYLDHAVRSPKAAMNWYGTKIAVIPAGERWQDGNLRPAWEDLITAGSILSYLDGSRSPEAEAAISAFQAVLVRNSSSEGLLLTLSLQLV